MMLARDLRCPATSSLGRWFDVAAALLGVCDIADYEGQAAMALEGLAASVGAIEVPDGCWRIEDGVLDLSPLLPMLLACESPARGAALFHAALAAALADWVCSAVDGQKGAQIAVGGGCAMNGVLMAALRRHLQAHGCELLEARQAPPNDGGLALGQAWVARRMFKERKNVSGNSRASC
jgi:hydrogenase maturation protein HypF